MPVWRPLLTVSAAACLTLLSACGSRHSDIEAKTKIKGAGSSFAFLAFQKWIEEFRKEYPEIAIRYDSVGSGKGESYFLANEVDFGATDAGLSDERLAEVKRGALQVPITAGSVVVAYNPEGLPKDLKLPRDVLADIFLGKVTKWNDDRIEAANPGKSLPSVTIGVVVRQDKSGTTYAVTNHLAAISKEWRDKYGSKKAESKDDLGVENVDWSGPVISASQNEGVAGAIRRTPYSVGYVQYGAARQARLGMAALQNKKGNYILPTGSSGLETLLNAKLPPNLRAYFPDPEGEFSYPIVTFTWALVYKHYDDAEKAAAVKEFLSWCLTKGQDYAEAAGNVRLAPHICRAGLKALESLERAK
jgi:phosphate transport system substrate-binding protein